MACQESFPTSEHSAGQDGLKCKCQPRGSHEPSLPGRHNDLEENNRVDAPKQCEDTQDHEQPSKEGQRRRTFHEPENLRLKVAGARAGLFVARSRAESPISSRSMKVRDALRAMSWPLVGVVIVASVLGVWNAQHQRTAVLPILLAECRARYAAAHTYRDTLSVDLYAPRPDLQVNPQGGLKSCSSWRFGSQLQPPPAVHN